MSDELTRADIEELEDRITALTRLVGDQLTVIRQFRDYMAWFKAEADKIVGAAGPLLSMVGPMMMQLMAEPAQLDAVIGSVAAGHNSVAAVIEGSTDHVG